MGSPEQTGTVNMIPTTRTLGGIRSRRRSKIAAYSDYVQGLSSPDAVTRANCAIKLGSLASISTVLERANAKLGAGCQANRTTSFLLPNQGMGVGFSASPEATRYGL